MDYDLNKYVLNSAKSLNVLRYFGDFDHFGDFVVRYACCRHICINPNTGEISEIDECDLEHDFVDYKILFREKVKELIKAGIIIKKGK